MNERIRELYRQAHGIRHYDGDPALDGNPPTVYWQGEASAERFANLLIRECIQVAGDNAVSLTETPDPNIGMAKLEVVRAIIRHFGVKE